MNETIAFRAGALACLFHHECDSRDEIAYRLSFARIGQSGASYGKLQTDCRTNQDGRAVIVNLLKAAGVAKSTVVGLAICLALRMPNGWRGFPQDLATIDSAIASPAGRTAVDAQDQKLLDGLLVELGSCREAAAPYGLTIADDAAMAICLWVNQSGAPTILKDWLAGHGVKLGDKDIPAPAPGVLTLDLLISGYLQHIPFEQQYPKQLPALREAVAVGMTTIEREKSNG